MDTESEHVPNFNMVPHPRWNTRGTRYACTMTPWVAAKVVAVFCGISLLVAGVSQVAMAVGTYTWRGFWITLVCGGLSTMAGVGMLVLPGRCRSARPIPWFLTNV